MKLVSLSKVANRTPMRSCVACGKSTAKQGLIRFVRGKDGVVSCDVSGRKAGRGAYLCADQSCLAQALKQGRLNRALRCQLSSDDKESLAEAFRLVCLEKQVLSDSPNQGQQ